MTHVVQFSVSSLGWVAALATLLVVACTRPDPLYCGSSRDCEVGALPHCDTELHTCTEGPGDGGLPPEDGGVVTQCTLHAQCPSRVCDRWSGECIDASQVAWAEPSGSDETCTSDTPCSFVAAVALGRPWIKAVGTFEGSGGGELSPFVRVEFGTDVVELRVVGTDDPTKSFFGATGIDAFEVIGGGSLWLDSVSIRVEPDLGLNLAAVKCGAANADPGAVYMRDVHIVMSDDYGLWSTNCNINAVGGMISGADTGVGLLGGSRFVGVDMLVSDHSGGGVWTELSTVSFDRSTIRDNGGRGMTFSAGSVMTVTNNIIVDNGVKGGEGGVLIDTAGGAGYFAFNTLVGNAANSGQQFDCENSPAVVIEGNLVWSSVAMPTDPNSCAVTAGGNAYYQSDATVLGASHHLLPGSPAIDGFVGEPQNEVPWDIDGDPRPNGNGHDFGADETVGL